MFQRSVSVTSHAPGPASCVPVSSSKVNIATILLQALRTTDAMNEAAALLAAVEIGDPLTRGSLALFPLFHERPAVREYLTWPRAAASVHVTEVDGGAAVPTLTVHNDNPLPLLLVDGETLVGAKQNRIVTVTT